MPSENADNTVTPPDQTQMALERTHLADERTLMAWIRTSAALITAGFSLYKFFDYLIEPARRTQHVLGSRNYGMCLIAIGVVTLALATWQHRQSMKRLRVQYPDAPFLAGDAGRELGFGAGNSGADRRGFSSIARVDSVARGDPLFRVRCGGRPVDAGALRECVAIGAERTMEQDPRFAFRIMVDIASKALSPAISDPTTAVLALDQIDRLMMHNGKRRLDAGQTLDAAGRLRLSYGTPDWTDLVRLAVTEIRQFGASSIQVARRLQAMLEHLLRVLPEARKPALQQELSLLQCAIQRNFPDEVDRAQAQVGDLQGIGCSESS